MSVSGACHRKPYVLDGPVHQSGTWLSRRGSHSHGRSPKCASFCLVRQQDSGYHVVFASFLHGFLIDSGASASTPSSPLPSRSSAPVTSPGPVVTPRSATAAAPKVALLMVLLLLLDNVDDLVGDS